MITSGTIDAFIKSSLEQIEKGIGDKFYLNKPIEFELSTMITKNTRGGFDIKVVQFGEDVESNAVQKIKFSVASKDSLEFKENEALKSFLDKKPEIIVGKYLKKPT